MDNDSFTSEEIEEPIRNLINSYPILTDNGSKIDIIEENDKMFYLVRGPEGPPGSTTIVKHQPTIIFANKSLNITPDVDYIVINANSSIIISLPTSTTKEKEYNNKFSSNILYIRCIDEKIHKIFCQSGEIFGQVNEEWIEISKFTPRTLVSIGGVWYFI